jgi:hypothetical protein
MQTIYQSIFKNLENYDSSVCYEKVFALNNYGQMLAKNDQTRLEGSDYIRQAEALQQ